MQENFTPSFVRIYAQILELVRSGSLDSLEIKIRRILRLGPNEWERVALADLAVKGHLFNLGLQILHADVFPDDSRHAQGLAEGRMIYAKALIWLGAFGAARRILTAEDLQNRFQALDLLGIAELKRWNFKEASEALERRALLSEGDEDSRLVSLRLQAQAAAFLPDGEAQSETLFEKVLRDAHPKRNAFFILETHHIRANTRIYQGRLREGLRDCQHVIARLKETQFQNFVPMLELARKVCEGSIRPADATRALNRMRGRWRDFPHRMLLRQLEFAIARRLEIREPFIQLYFGSPYAGLRREVLRWIAPSDLPAYVDSPLHQPASSSKDFYDPWLFFQKSAATKKGQLSFRMLSAVASDFYQPTHLLEVFHLLHPDETYSPISSPNRLTQSLHRFKTLFRKTRTGLCIEVQNGRAVLITRYHVKIRIHRENLLLEDDAASSSSLPGVNALPLSAPPTVRAALQEIVQTWAKAAFGAREAAAKLGLSHRSAGRILRAGVEAGILQVEGAGRNTVYRVVSLKDSTGRGSSARGEQI